MKIIMLIFKTPFPLRAIEFRLTNQKVPLQASEETKFWKSQTGAATGFQQGACLYF